MFTKTALLASAFLMLGTAVGEAQYYGPPRPMMRPHHGPMMIRPPMYGQRMIVQRRVIIMTNGMRGVVGQDCDPSGRPYSLAQPLPRADRCYTNSLGDRVCMGGGGSYFGGHSAFRNGY